MARIEDGAQPAAVIEHGAQMKFHDRDTAGQGAWFLEASIEQQGGRPRPQMHPAGPLEIVGAENDA